MAKRKWKAGDRIETFIGRGRDGRFYSMVRGPGPDDVVVHGPFATEGEADQDEQQTVRAMVGPQSEIKNGGMWDPTWDKPQ
jgi:hypothetical protein